MMIDTMPSVGAHVAVDVEVTAIASGDMTSATGNQTVGAVHVTTKAETGILYRFKTGMVHASLAVGDQLRVAGFVKRTYSPPPQAVLEGVTWEKK